MFYSGIEKAGSKEAGTPIIVVETVWWFFLWCILEAFALEGIVDFIVDSFRKTGHLFESLDMDRVAFPFDWASYMFRSLEFLGTGSFPDWMERGLILWACTALPVLIWRGSRMESRYRYRNR